MGGGSIPLTWIRRATCIRLAEGNGFTVPIFMMFNYNRRCLTDPSRIDTAIDLETGHSPFIIPPPDTFIYNDHGEWISAP